jgi:hypothetical protein
VSSSECAVEDLVRRRWQFTETVQPLAAGQVRFWARITSSQGIWPSPCSRSSVMTMPWANSGAV